MPYFVLKRPLLGFVCLDSLTLIATFAFDNGVRIKVRCLMKTIRIGVDVGSTTAKIVALDEQEKVVFSDYRRHNARAKDLLLTYLEGLMAKLGDVDVAVNMTGSVGMGVSEQCSLPFVQEVVAATKTVQKRHSGVRSLIDIGGEDAKVVFFNGDRAADLRMNGNCAGGTGAFIDQMAILLGVSPERLNGLAQEAKSVHNIASRCGVFSKTDVQNLIAKNVCKEDIAASVFHAVAVQVVVTLAHGCDIQSPVLMCGGPLTFIPALRKAFIDYLKIDERDVIVPQNSHLIPAVGAALSAGESQTMRLSALIDKIKSGMTSRGFTVKGLEPIFTDEADHARFTARMAHNEIREVSLQKGKAEVSLGIDSGSTTTKIVALNAKGEMVFHYYHNNEGNPIATAQRGLTLFKEQCDAVGAEVSVNGSCSTGYGEDLLRASFRLDHGIIETIAHYMAARRLTNDVSFILDIGGQDMKAIFVSGGVVNRMEINEACSSGCGSFIETFAKSLGYTVDEFSREACRAKTPYDLGTRCTVFMNSKVKQALREGATVADIAAGLSYSVVKNCLYKVLRLKNTAELGSQIVVQGGTMRNDSVVRAFEKLTGHDVFRSSHPELMGAVGCALYAQKQGGRSVSLAEMIDSAEFTMRQQACHGCENQCLVTTYRFAGGNRYYSGNRCERVFTNGGKAVERGVNAYEHKLKLLFNRDAEPSSGVRIGIPRSLNMYEEYPFWHTLFTQCGLNVVLSDASTYVKYEASANQVMSDNICFPAKLVHSHIRNLTQKGVSRIFMPFVVYERNDGGQNSFNCPIVSGYSDVVKGTEHYGVPIDAPAITFKDKTLLLKQCVDYLKGLGVSGDKVKMAFNKAVSEQEKYQQTMADYCRNVLAEARNAGRLVILLAGRPYHADPLIQHKLADMVASMGADVITEDIVRGVDVGMNDVNFVPQWAYANRILKAAEWAAGQDEGVQMMQMTSFGCGPDAFLTDETRTLLKRHGKALTLLKIDDVSNIGSLKLRVRSVIESMKLAVSGKRSGDEVATFDRTPVFERSDRRRKIIAPFFTPFISPLIPSLVRLTGYEVENLPVSDAQSGEWGLRYANNEVCYPATLIVGDIVKAFKSGRYQPDDTAVIITQTGGQCRASNYISLIKKALTESGYGSVPVLSLAAGSGIQNEQPGFKINWLKILPIVVTALIYSDSLAKMYYATAVREREEGVASRLLNKYLEAAQTAINHNSSKELWTLLDAAAHEFNAAATDKDVAKVGIVGEIFLKFNPFAQKDITAWLTEQGIEVVPPLLLDFFLQSFVNTEVNQMARLERKSVPKFVMRWLYNKVWKQIDKANAVCKSFRHFAPFESIYIKADEAKQVVSMFAQFGEGWLLPGEILSMARQGVSHVISLQPFGCIANHIVARGIEKRIKAVCPDLNLLSLDFDSGVSDVNVRNRILLFIDNLRPCGREVVRS